MNGINKAIIMGHVGQDPKIQNFQNGGKAANFTIATTERGYTMKDGRQVPDKTEWHNVVCFGSVAGVVERFVRKGTPVYVEGKIRTRSYDDQQGQKHYVTEINVDQLQLLGGKQDSQQGQQAGAQGASQYANDPFPPMDNGNLPY